MLSEAMPDAEVLTEDDERRLGWGGKTNDVTVIRGDSAVLIECKLSGLYVNAKRTASPESIIADVRKQIADAKDRRGLFQLHDKLQAIQTRLLPQSLLDKYSNVKHFYPVLLLFDDISQANAAEVLGNIIRDELRANGIDAFEYQIWNLEELEWLTEQSGADSLSWIAEKFSSKNQAMDLSSFVADKAHKEFLRPIMYLPEGDTRAIQILKGLVAKYAVAQSD
jgi:NADPH-dependent 7-cyano-7-deazaguanine reductase QueF-like protein